MTLADYLESKAEYIFDRYSNYTKAYFYGLKRKRAEEYVKVIIDGLKRGLRELAQIHDRKFLGLDARERFERIRFEGYVYVVYGSGEERNEYQLHISFFNWAFTKIMLEKTNKDFTDLFHTFVNIEKGKYNKVSEIEEVYARGNFSSNFKYYYQEYLACKLPVSNPRISKFIKSNALNILKGKNVMGLFVGYYNVSEGPKIEVEDFRDFSLISANMSSLKDYKTRFIRFIVADSFLGGSEAVIELKPEEYVDMSNSIKNIISKEEVPSRDICLKDVLKKYTNLWLKKKMN